MARSVVSAARASGRAHHPWVDRAGGLGALSRMSPGNSPIRFRLPRKYPVGSGVGRLRGAAVHLRNAGFLPDRARDRRAAGRGDGALPDGNGAGKNQAARDHGGRDVGRSAERDLWIVGNLRPDPLRCATICSPGCGRRLDSFRSSRARSTASACSRAESSSRS